MNQALTKEQRFLLWLLLLSSLTGITIWYFDGLSFASFSAWFSETITWISYFTNLTNFLIVVMAATLLRGNGRLYDFFKSPHIQAAFCLYIFFVGLAYWLLLGDPSTVTGLKGWIPELTAHTLSPILGVVYWIRGVPWGQLEWHHPLRWLIYPITYLIYWLIRGPIVNYYPYFFVDVNDLGYGGVAIWSGILIAVFLVLGSIMWGVDRKLAPVKG